MQTKCSTAGTGELFNNLHHIRHLSPVDPEIVCCQAGRRDTNDSLPYYCIVHAKTWKASCIARSCMPVKD